MRIVDLSNNNNLVVGPAFTLMKKAGGIGGVYHKLTEGETWRDDKAALRIQAARAAKLRVGFYHFARPDLHPGTEGAIKEALNFVNALRGRLKPGDLKPALDFETKAPGDQVAWARAFNKVVKKQLGVYPIFYSYTSFIKDLHASKPIGSGLWLADYGVNNGIPYNVRPPAPWKKVFLHQFSSRALVAGAGRVDVSVTASRFGALPLIYRPLRSKITKLLKL